MQPRIKEPEPWQLLEWLERQRFLGKTHSQSVSFLRERYGWSLADVEERVEDAESERTHRNR